MSKYLSKKKVLNFNNETSIKPLTFKQLHPTGRSSEESTKHPP